MISISKNVYIDKLNDIVKKYNNTYHTSIKMKPVDVNTYIGFKKEVNDKNHKFRVGDQVRISKYKNIFAKGYMPNWSEEILLKKLKILYHGHMFLMTLMVKKLSVPFMKTNCKRLIKKNSE